MLAERLQCTIPYIFYGSYLLIGCCWDLILWHSDDMTKLKMFDSGLFVLAKIQGQVHQMIC